MGGGGERERGGVGSNGKRGRLKLKRGQDTGLGDSDGEGRATLSASLRATFLVLKRHTFLKVDEGCGGKGGGEAVEKKVGERDEGRGQSAGTPGRKKKKKKEI
jgi:hypothetical protein